MPERLKKRAMRVVGVRQVLRAVKEGSAESVFLAMDAEARLRYQVEQAAKEMEELENKCKTIEENKDREIENLVTDLKTSAKSKMDETVELVKKAIG